MANFALDVAIKLLDAAQRQLETVRAETKRDDAAALIKQLTRIADALEKQTQQGER